MTQTITKDRTHYRALTDAELIEEAKRGVRVDWRELGLVLAERLETNREPEPRYCPQCDEEF